MAALIPTPAYAIRSFSYFGGELLHALSLYRSSYNQRKIVMNALLDWVRCGSVFEFSAGM